MKNLLLVFLLLLSTTVQAQRIFGPYWIPVDTEHGSVHDVAYYVIEDSGRLLLGFTQANKDVHCIVKTVRGTSERILVFPLTVDDQKIIDTRGFTVVSITCQEDTFL